MNPKVAAKKYYKSIGAVDDANCLRLRLAACAQLGRTVSLQYQAKLLAEQEAPKEMIKAKEMESELRSKHALVLDAYSKDIQETLKKRKKLDKGKKP
ncbi:MAG TPA: hypothetical protein ENJ18_16140 [Nannocystis exedens]|nr:hypothetical protein [Nannocystis exedens]